MVEERITDARRIAQLLASELDGREGPFAGVSVTGANQDAGPSPDGTRAYDVEREGRRVATVSLVPERVLVEVLTDPDRALELAGEAGLRARPKAGDPPRTLVFVESGAAVKRAADVLAELGGERGE